MGMGLWSPPAPTPWSWEVGVERVLAAGVEVPVGPYARSILAGMCSRQNAIGRPTSACSRCRGRRRPRNRRKAPHRSPAVPLVERQELLVVGAGPYAYSAAALARDHGIKARIVGHPMAFWRQHMPADMFLRSGPDWHLDGRGEHTFEAFFEDRGLRPEELDPIPVAVFLDYAQWFRAGSGSTSTSDS